MLHDIRFALRGFRHHPGFTLAAILTLGLGIGANAAIFSVIDAALLHPLPFPDPDRLVALYQRSGDEHRDAISYPNLLDWQKQAGTFENLAGVKDEDNFTLTGRGEPEQVMGLAVSSNFLDVLRTQPLAGRMFTPAEDQRGGAPVALLCEDFWRRRLGGDPKILGQALRLNGRDYTVIGIVSNQVARVRFDNSAAPSKDLITPLGQNTADIFYQRGVGDNTIGLGRMKAGVTLAQVRAEMDRVTKGLAAEYPKEDKDVGADVLLYREDLSGALQPVLLALAAAVGFVLLIASVNVANLVLARSAGRSQEFGVRSALGAARGRLMRQLLTENLLLGLAGGVLGVLVASWLTAVVLTVLPSVLPSNAQVQINLRVLLVSLGLSLAAGVLCGFVPAFRAAGVSLQDTLRQSGRGVVRGWRKPQYALIVAEVALTLILLVSTGLMIRTLRNLWSVNPGFQPENLLVFYTSLQGGANTSPENTIASLRELNRRLGAIPGVEAAGVEAGGLPFLGNTGLGFASQDEFERSQKANRLSHFYWVSPDHFKTMGIPLLRGRPFTDHDSRNSPLVAVIDEDTARSVFPGQDAVGKFLHVGLYEQPLQIVGIAGRVKHGKLDSGSEASQYAQIYSPLDQMPEPILPVMTESFAGIVRSRMPQAALLKAVTKNVSSFDGGAVFGEQWMSQAVAESLAPRRFSLILLGAFAGLALILSFVGILGVVSYLISQRTHEIGVRMTLGARPQDIFIGVLREAAIAGGTGITIGLAGAAALTRLMAGMLYGIRPVDAVTFLCAAALLFVCTLLACWAPARRAIRVDPAAALRSA